MDLWAYCVCKGQWARVRESTMKPAGKPDAGNPHVRFDERGLGNGTAIRVSTRAQPRLYRRGRPRGPGLRFFDYYCVDFAGAVYAAHKDLFDVGGAAGARD